MFGVDAKQAKILKIAEACALGLFWTRNARSEQKPTQKSVD